MFGLKQFFDRATGLEREYGPVEIHGIALRCQVCRHDEFWQHRAQVHTPTATFLDFEAFNRVADCAVCARCGYVHWFLPIDLAPQRADEAVDTEDPGPQPLAI